MNEALAHLSREQLEQLAEAYAKNAIALDGVWFQATERDVGMEAAMRYDCEAWERFGLTEARRLKALLGLGEQLHESRQGAGLLFGHCDRSLYFSK